MQTTAAYPGSISQHYRPLSECHVAAGQHDLAPPIWDTMRVHQESR